MIFNPAKHPRLSLRTEWPVRIIGPNLSEVLVDEDVIIQVRAMVSPTIEHSLWIEGLMREHLPRTARLEQRAFTPMLSTRGWPIVFAHYEIYDRRKLLEERVGAFYRIVHNHAEVMVRLRNGRRWSAYEARLMPVILSAHVDWPSAEDDVLLSLLGIRL